MPESNHDDQAPEPGWESRVASLPASPGCYLFKDRAGKILYVGKAKNLRARVRAYTRDSGDTRQHIQFLRRKIHDFDYLLTDTEKEALILENNLIKRHKPQYNIDLRDNKTFFHARLTMSEEFPRLELTRRPKKGARDLLFGPFSSSAAAKETIRTVQEIFPLRRCKSKELRHRSRPCLNYQIGKCSGACAGKISREDYGLIVDQVVKFMKGSRPQLAADLKAQMERAAAELDFERAALLRDRIAAIEQTLEKQKVDTVRPMDRDVWGLHREGDRVAVHRLSYRAGVLLGGESSSFVRVALPDDEVLSSVLSQTYSAERKPPPELLTSLAPADQDVLEEAFTELLGRKSMIRVPERGEGREMTDLARTNARDAATRERERGEDRERAQQELQSRLRLTRLPRWIECVDISLLGGESAVGSVVKFLAGEPDKAGYRRYRIRSVEGVNDYGMMKEVLSRRFQRALEEGAALPDLLVVDGGKGQLNVARAVLEELSLERPEVVSLAKDRETGDPKSEKLQKKGERVFVPGAKDPVFLRPGGAALFLVQNVRDEAHRFAVSYHKLLRGKKVKRSRLMDVPGIGPRKAAVLLKALGGLARVREADEAAIAAVPGISESDARRIVKFFAGQE